MGGLVLIDERDFGWVGVNRGGNNDFERFKIIFLRISSLFMPSESSFTITLPGMSGWYRINAEYSQLLPVSHFPLSLASDV